MSRAIAVLRRRVLGELRRHPERREELGAVLRELDRARDFALTGRFAVATAVAARAIAALGGLLR